jgi:gliding motility-associated-like protein
LCAEAKITITFDDDIICKAPNIITPNEDGINDYFVIPCLESGRFPENKVVIFNEWGTSVYEASPYNNDWGGTYGGNPLPAGTYFYILDTGLGQIPVNGFLIVQR